MLHSGRQHPHQEFHQHAVRRRRPFFRPGFEPLEERTMLSATGWFQHPPSGEEESWRAVEVDSDGSVFVAATSRSLTSDLDILLRKYSADGAEAWSKEIQATGRDEVWGMTIDPSGDYLDCSQRYE